MNQHRLIKYDSSFWLTHSPPQSFPCTFSTNKQILPLYLLVNYYREFLKHKRKIEKSFDEKWQNVKKLTKAEGLGQFPCFERHFEWLPVISQRLAFLQKFHSIHLLWNDRVPFQMMFIHLRNEIPGKHWKWSPNPF